jgi:hypothetical protein
MDIAPLSKYVVLPCCHGEKFFVQEDEVVFSDLSKRNGKQWHELRKSSRFGTTTATA